MSAGLERTVSSSPPAGRNGTVAAGAGAGTAAQWLARTLLMWALILVAALIFAYPLLFMVTAAFKPGDAVFSRMGDLRALVPDATWSFDNFQAIFAKGQIGRYLLNSSIIALFSVSAGLLVNSAAAFALAKLRWPGRRLMLGLVLAILIIPFETLAIPLLLLVSKLPWFDWQTHQFVIGWLDSMQVQILPFVANAFCVFLFYQFFKDLPDELIEAGRMDGAGAITIFFQLVLPVCKPVLVTAAIVLFLAMWNQYLWPVMAVQTSAHRPLMVGLQQYFGRTNQWGEIMAYATVATLPVLVIFLIFQKQFIRSVVGSGIKG